MMVPYAPSSLLHDNGSHHIGGMVGANIVIGTTFSKRELKGSTKRKVPTIKHPIVGDRMGNAPIIRPDHSRTNRDC